ncbi:hypothetical protein [Staphylococcus haemolyticus]|uniref:hypothetical protein n=1 Tax=Staphylococcus haemolyticus TaxID=1283 RepID=UPI000623F350|nr:hypothetical protein [Staphylococcus haemolyticus]KKI56574.1 Phage protein [Staphylococcus haemolyticus]
MKKFLVLIFSSALILGACGNDDTSNNDSDSKSESKTEKKSEDKKESKSKEEKNSQENENNNSTEEQNTQETATNEQQPATQEQQQTQQANNNQQNEQRYDYDNNGVYRTPEEQKAHEDWVNGQIEWNKQQEAKEQKLQDEYFDLSDKMYEDGVSESEYNSMEKRQEEILDEVEPIN